MQFETFENNVIYFIRSNAFSVAHATQFIRRAFHANNFIEFECEHSSKVKSLKFYGKIPCHK